MTNFERYHALHDEVMKRLEDGEITTESAKELNDRFFNRYIMDDNIFTEKATREEYRMSAFKKKYNYDPKEKTIVVNGETYKVDLDTKRKTMEVYNIVSGEKEATIRQTAADMGDPDSTIHISADFFKLKNNKRRDAVLQHEIGHIKLHNANPSSKKFDSDKSAPIVVHSILEEVVQKVCQMHGITDKEDIKSIRSEVHKIYGDMKNNYYDKMSKDKLIRKIREDAFKIAKKYESKSNSHTNAKEFEADRYAANHSSEKDLKKGVREYYKYGTSDKAIKSQLKTAGADTSDETVSTIKKLLKSPDLPI